MLQLAYWVAIRALSKHRSVQQQSRLTQKIRARLQTVSMTEPFIKRLQYKLKKISLREKLFQNRPSRRKIVNMFRHIGQIVCSRLGCENFPNINDVLQISDSITSSHLANFQLQDKVINYSEALFDYSYALKVKNDHQEVELLQDVLHDASLNISPSAYFCFQLQKLASAQLQTLKIEHMAPKRLKRKRLIRRQSRELKIIQKMMK